MKYLLCMASNISNIHILFRVFKIFLFWSIQNDLYIGMKTYLTLKHNMQIPIIIIYNVNCLDVIHILKIRIEYLLWRHSSIVAFHHDRYQWNSTAIFLYLVTYRMNDKLKWFWFCKRHLLIYTIVQYYLIED